jgi:site-specific recombinase XerC
MSRITDPARVCLHVKAWPEADQRLWEAALAHGDYEDEASPAAGWRPGTVQTNREGYGRWMNFLIRTEADLSASLGERVTPERVRAYVLELADQGLAVQTRCNRISQLYSVMAALCPTRDWSWLKRRSNRMAVFADDARRTEPLDMFTGDILSKALKALKSFCLSESEISLNAAIEFRNWLMVATVTLVPLRRSNFAALSVSKHLRRTGHDWRVELPAEEAKHHKPIVMPIPEVLHRHLENYFTSVRPVLLAGRVSDRFWISVRGKPMTSHSIYISMTKFTREALGTAINPHRFRHIGASTVVVANPSFIEAARALLTHGDTQTTKDHYIIGQSLFVGRQNSQLIATLRRRSADANRAILKSA